MTLKVLLDATALPAQRVGVGHYVTELVGALGERPGDVDLHVILKERDVGDLSDIAGAATLHPAGPRNRPSRIVWEHTVLPRHVRRLRPAVLHGPHYTLPAGTTCPAVITFHDPTFFTHPELHERAKVTYFRRMSRLGGKRAARVIAVSEYGRRGAVEHIGVEPDRVDVVPHGIDHDRYRPEPTSSDERLRARIGVREPYILWVGALEPRKDVPTLVAAFAELVRAGAQESLVLVGPPAWGAAAIESAIADSGVTDRIHQTGYVTEEEKAALYRGATVFASPSIAEGFGFPVLEAMACGTPVVTTTGSAPEEVAADAAVLVMPGDADALRAGLTAVLGDEARAAELRRRGPERASVFTWQRSAEATIDVYRRASEVDR